MNAVVCRVDASMMQVQFDSQQLTPAVHENCKERLPHESFQITEWIYRASPRLLPLFQALVCSAMPVNAILRTTFLLSNFSFSLTVLVKYSYVSVYQTRLDLFYVLMKKMLMKKKGSFKAFLNFCHIHQKRSVYLYRCADGAARTLTIEFSRDMEKSTEPGKLEYDVRTGIVREQFTYYKLDPTLDSDELTITSVHLPSTASSSSAITTSSSSALASASTLSLESPTRVAAAGSAVRATALGARSHTLPKSLADMAKRREQPDASRSLLNSSSPSGAPNKLSSTFASVTLIAKCNENM